jgi:16S rRNA (cytidine1402-2'-O)-methyltransferase
MLYLVATPIGNLGDISLRALDILREVDYIASEDTRKTGLLLKHLDIKKPQISFHEHNEVKAGKKIISLMLEGHSVALVTNAGTPGISDPGYTLVRLALTENIQITAIPGPTAFVMAVILSGLPVHSFTFRGFPPHKAGGRRKFLKTDENSIYTLIYYESPYRIKEFLNDALDIFGDRKAALANDLTKLFEKVDRGNLSELVNLDSLQNPKGEYTVVISGADG